MAQSRLQKNQASPSIKSKKRSKKIYSNQNRYVQHLPMLIVAAITFGWLAIIIYSYYPQEVADTLLHNSYFAVLLPFFLSCSFLTGYLLLDIRKGITIGWLFTSIFFLRLQNISISVASYLALIGFTLAILFLNKLLKK